MPAHTHAHTHTRTQTHTHTHCMELVYAFPSPFCHTISQSWPLLEFSIVFSPVVTFSVSVDSDYHWGITYTVKVFSLSKTINESCSQSYSTHISTMQVFGLSKTVMLTELWYLHLHKAGFWPLKEACSESYNTHTYTKQVFGLSKTVMLTEL